jgi:transposase InsO family protein
VEQFSIIAKPLYELTRKNVQFVWSERQQTDFEILKQRLSTAPVLASPLAEGKYILDVDASGHRAGAIFEQEQEGKVRVISYASRLFNSSEQTYCVTRQELAAVVFGLKKSKHYLLGQHVLVRSDHAALSYWRRTKKPVAQQARWFDFIEQFNITLQYRSSSANRAADALSRRPCESNQPCQQCKTRQGTDGCLSNEHVHKAETVRCAGVLTRALAKQQGALPINPTDDLPPQVKTQIQFEREERTVKKRVNNQQQHALLEQNQNFRWSIGEIQNLQNQDKTIGTSMTWLRGVRPPEAELAGISPELRSLWLQWDYLLLRNEIAYRQFLRPNRSVERLQKLITRSMLTELLHVVHVKYTAHLRYDKTAEQIQRRAYWPSWKTDVKLYCTRCRQYNEFHSGKATRHASLKPLRADAPMECLHVDLTGPHVCSQGYNYIMTVADSFTRYVIATPIRNKTALSVAKVLVSEVVLKYGMPFAILTDQGREFQNELIAELCRLMDISGLKTTVYTPSTNGKIERWHRSLNAMMAKLVDTKQKHWTELLPFLVAAYNNSVHSSTSFTPNFLMFGHDLLTPIDVAMGVSGTESRSANDYAQHVRDSLAEAYGIVRRHWKIRSEAIKKHYGLSVKPIKFEESDQVLYFCPRTTRGTSPKWSKLVT